MGITEEQVEEYQNRLKQLAKRDYFYLFIGLIVVTIAGLFLYSQLHPGKILSLFNRNDIINKETLKKTNDIAGIIQQRDINFISPTPANGRMGLSNPNPSPTSAETLSRPEENGQTSSIATGQVTNRSKTYTVQEGDNLEYIAGMMYGDREAWPIIAEANDILWNPDAIYAGMVLVIPR